MIWTLRDIFDSVIPYREGIAVISNQSIPLAYDPGTKTGSLGTFPDCMETLIRHICNLICFDSKKREFVIPDGFPLAHQLRSFYSSQPSRSSNSGDVHLRSLWNLVVSKQPGVIYKQKAQETSPSNDTEIRSGIRNLITVLHNITGVAIDPYPENAPLEAKTQWIEKTLGDLFTRMNPSHVYEFKMDTPIEGTLEGQKDMSGDITVTVFDKPENPLFSFVIHVSLGAHGVLWDIKNLISKDPLESGLQQEVIPYPLCPNTIEELIDFLNPNPKEGHHLLYTFLGFPMQDNEGRKRFVDALLGMKIEAISEYWKKPLKQSLVHVLSNMSWGDEAVGDSKFSDVLRNGINHPLYRDTLRNQVKSLYLKNSNLITEILDAFPLLERLTVNNPENMTKLVFSKEYPHLTELEIFDAGQIQNVDGLFYLPSLKSFVLNAPKLKSLGLSHNMERLSRLLLRGSGVENLEKDLAYCPHLEELYLTGTKNLTSLIFPESMKNLKKINLTKSNIQTLQGLENCHALKEFTQEGKSLLTSLVFPESMKNLKKINLWGTNIQTLQGLENCPNLEYLNLRKGFTTHFILKKSRKGQSDLLIKKFNIPLDKIIWEEDELENIVDVTQIKKSVEDLRSRLPTTLSPIEIANAVINRYWLLSNVLKRTPDPLMMSRFLDVELKIIKIPGTVSFVEANTRSWDYFESYPTDLPVSFHQAQTLKNRLPEATAHMLAGKEPGLRVDFEKASPKEKEILLRGLGTIVRSILSKGDDQNFVATLNTLFNSDPQEDPKLTSHKMTCKLYALAMAKGLNKSTLLIDQEISRLNEPSKKVYQEVFQSEEVKNAIAPPTPNHPLRLAEVFVGE